MKKMMSYQTCIRVASIVMLVLPVVVSLLCGAELRAVRSTFSVAAFCADAVLLCVPVARQERKDSVIFAAVFILLGASAALSCSGKNVLVALTGAAMLCYVIFLAVRKFGKIRLLFGDNAVWHSVEEYVKLNYVIIFLTMGLWAVVCNPAEGALAWPPVCFLSFLYAALYYKAYTGFTLFIGRGKEDKIKSLARVTIQNRLSTEDESELLKMKAVYVRCLNTMEEKKPFLNPDLSLDDLSVLVFCNRSYLSRSINSFSGMNFRQFINHCRIEYALELIAGDPHLKVSELSNMCGFNTPVSFTMAFKLNVGVLPSDYIKDRAFSKP